MDSLISRETLIKELEEYIEYDAFDLYKEEPLISLGFEQLEDIICSQQTFEQPMWIPCSKSLPKSEDKYGWIKCNVTVMRSHWPTSSYDSCDSPYDEYFVADAMYDVSQKIWHLGEHTQLNALIDIEDSPLNGDYVIA